MGPLGGKGALFEFPLSHKVTTLGKINLSMWIKQKKNHREPLSLSFLEKYIFGTSLLYLLIYRLFWKDNWEVDLVSVGPGTIQANPVPWNTISFKLGAIVQSAINAPRFINFYNFFEKTYSNVSNQRGLFYTGLSSQLRYSIC